MDGEAVAEGKGEQKGTKIMMVVLAAFAAFVVIIFVMTLVIAVLFYIGVLNPKNVTPTSCTFPPGMTCSGYKLHPDGALDMRIGQATGHPILVEKIACVPVSTEPIPSDYAQVGVAIPIGEQRWVSGQEAAATVKCGSGGQAGDFYRAKLWVEYTETDTGIARTFVGDLATKYEN